MSFKRVFKIPTRLYAVKKRKLRAWIALRRKRKKPGE
jgi:hypothetical protein